MSNFTVTDGFSKLYKDSIFMSETLKCIHILLNKMKSQVLVLIGSYIL